MAQTIRPDMEDLWSSSHLSGGSSAWVESLYELYLEDPESIDAEWRQVFDALPTAKSKNGNGSGGLSYTEIPHSEVRASFKKFSETKNKYAISQSDVTSQDHENKQVQVLQLINAHRFRGHQVAKVNPLHDGSSLKIDELDLNYHGLTEDDFDTEFDTGSLAGPKTLSLKNIYAILCDTYCESVGAEYMHITETEEKRWLQQRLETMRGRPNLSFEEKNNILQQLTNAEGLEKYLHTKYVGQKRFSLEGGESLVPLLDELVLYSGIKDIKEIVIGMAHRGRLNVLVNIMGKTPAELFQEFDGTKEKKEVTGDVKYHLGFSSDMATKGGVVHLALAFNPSHLEIVAPVVEGSVRARQWRRGDRKGIQVVPVQIHGDAAFSGQGVVMETLQMSQSRGYSTKGTVHIIVNNQIGFTTSSQQDARSTNYCTDIAKMVGAPIFHVNGDDPEAVIMVTRLAVDYRMTFKKDVVIDMVCYRRHGHNEADEPRVTQPMMYKKIKPLPSVREKYANQLVAENVLSSSQTGELIERCRSSLEAGKSLVPHKVDDEKVDHSTRVSWDPFTKAGILDDVDTTVPLKTIRKLSAAIEKLPEGFELQARVQKIFQDRHKMCAGALPIDWGYAEIMAYASLVDDGFSVRLSGQDSGRGTFFHRHAAVHNQVDGESFTPLRNLGTEHANFRVFDSLLSELAVLGFEYGFSTAEPDTLGIWEAQFGDFANGAQIVIDQFIVSGEHKWGRASGLVMLLPHGYEGQGAEHSSARLERYLQLCSEHNIQVCVPSTPAQIFHLLRRQMVRQCRKPLVVLTPKSLLRNKLCVSSLDDLTKGSFQWVIPEIDDIEPNDVKRVVLCYGKVYYELLEARRLNQRLDIAIIRVEQLYPLSGEKLEAELSKYTQTDELIWCQEEPKNQGGWDFCKVRLEALIDKRWKISYIGRNPSSAPAVGSAKLHASEQKTIIDNCILFD